MDSRFTLRSRASRHTEAASRLTGSGRAPTVSDMAEPLEPQTGTTNGAAAVGGNAGPSAASAGVGKQTLTDAAGAMAGPGKQPQVATGNAAANEVAPGDAAPAVSADTVAARDWPTVLPHANRDKDHQITITKGTPATTKGKDKVAAVQNTAHVPEIDKPALDDAKQKIVATIAAHREALPDVLSAKYGAAKGCGGVGYMYGGKDAAKPTAVQAGGADKPALQNKWVWEEVGSEGGASSVNTYDGMDVTFGKGFAAGGAVEAVLTSLFAKDPEAKNLFLDAGVTIAKGQWQMVNTELGAIEDGKNALRLFEVNPKLLSVFVTMAEDPKHAQTNLDVQWDQLKKGAGNIPEYAKEWDEFPTKLAVHLKHWLPGYAWVNNDYSATKGDTLAIVKRFASIMVAREKTATKSGALRVDGKTPWGTVSHLKILAKGAGFTALAAAAKTATISKDDLDSDAQYAGQLLFPLGKDQYYVLPE